MRRVRFNPRAKRDWDDLPEAIQRSFGLRLEQEGVALEDVPGAPERKSLAGIAPGVWELKRDDRDGTYRGVYTVKLEDAIYVLHSFKKKSTQGISTSRADVELINSRLKWAEADHAAKRKAGGAEERG